MIDKAMQSSSTRIAVSSCRRLLGRGPTKQPQQQLWFLIMSRSTPTKRGSCSSRLFFSSRPSVVMEHPLPKHAAASAPLEQKSPMVSKEEEETTQKKRPTSPSEVTYSGGATMPITSTLRIFTKDELPGGSIWPVFRLMDESGHFRDPQFDGFKIEKAPPPLLAEHQPDLSSDHENRHDLNALRLLLQQQNPTLEELHHNALLHESNRPLNADDMARASSSTTTQVNNTLLRAYRHMVRLRQMDKILQNAQRQGRISFYMTCRGEEAIHIGAASALYEQDTIFAQYREAGLLMWRGFTLEQFTNQCFANEGDLGRGRQMPVHYGCRALNYHTISSPLGTQLPQATGAAYRLKMLNQQQDDDNHDAAAAVSVCFFGDGCASTTDFHSALNFAATLRVPVIFFCRNNGYAISTPVTDQYAGDGIVTRAYGYGMAGLRVDGNDLFAVSAAVKRAREYALQHNAPILVEAMTYRQGHHSTSDDSTRYRSSKEVQDVSVSADPVKRIKAFLNEVGWMDTNEAAAVRDEEKLAVLEAMQAAEQRPKPKLEYLFQDVYHNVPQHLQRQQEQLQEHMEKYPNRY